MGQNNGNESITTLDSSGNGYDGTVTNATWVTANKGLTDYYDFVLASEAIISGNGAVPDVQNITQGMVSCWVNVDNIGVLKIFWGFSDSGDNDSNMRLYWAAGNQKIQALCVENNSIKYNDWFDGAPILVANAWTHLVLVQNGVSPVLYVNGIGPYSINSTNLVDPTAWFHTVNDIDSVTIGAWVRSGSPTQFSDQKIWAYELSENVPTDAEILSNYKTQVAQLGIASQASYDLGLDDNKVLDVTFSGDTVQDGSVNAFALTDTATSNVDLGVINGARSFNGSTSKIALPSGVLITSDTECTFVFWAKKDTGADHARLLAYNSDGLYCLLRMCNGDVDNTFDVDLAGGGGIAISTSVHEWHHYVFTAIEGGVTKLYVDGIEEGASSNTNFQQTLTVGRYIGSNRGGNARFFDGSMDEVKIFNTALSTTNITDLYEKESVLFGNIDGIWDYSWYDNLVAFYTFNDGTSKNWADMGRTGNNGTDTAVTYSIANGDAEFNGSTSFISLPSVIGNFETNDSFNVSAWINPNSFAGNKFIFGKQVNGGDWEGWGLRQDSAHKLTLFLIGVDPSSRILVSSPINSLTSNVWQHVTASYDGSSSASGVTLYIDGVEQVPEIFSDNLDESILSDVDLSIGSLNGGDSSWSFSGLMDNAMILDTELTPTQIQEELFDDQKATFGYLVGWDDETFADDTVALYTFNRDSSQDYSGNGNHGTDTAVSYSDGVAEFNGSTSYINLGDSIDFHMGSGGSDLPFSASMWLYQNVDETTSPFGKFGGGGANEYEMLTLAGDGYSFRCYDDSNNVYIGRKTSSGLITNEWVHLAFTYDGSALNSGITIYINGVQTATIDAGSGSYFAMSNESTDLTIGMRRNGSIHYDGLMDNFMLVKGIELTPIEIQTLYNDYPHEGFTAGQ